MFIDPRERLSEYNTPESSVRSNSELIEVSEKINDKAIYCEAFAVSKKAIDSLKKNGNAVIGTGRSR